MLRNLFSSLTESTLAAVSVAGPGFALAELSTPMLIRRAPGYAELHTAYRFRRPLLTAGLAAGGALLADALRRRSTTRSACITAATLTGMAAVAPLIYDPLLFRPRQMPLRIRSAEEAPQVFEDDDTEVIGVVLNGESRAYPVRQLTRPHLVYDVLGGEEIVITYCGLTNSALIYRSQEGYLPHLAAISAPNNNVVFWEEQTESLVQQLLPHVAFGPAEFLPLRTMPAVVTSWQAWQRLVPQTTLGDSPYDGWQDRCLTALARWNHFRLRTTRQPLMAVAGGADDTLHPKLPVLGLWDSGEARCYTRDLLRARGAVNDAAGGRPVAVFYTPAGDIASAYRRQLDGRQLQFRANGEGQFEDEETGTRWDLLGRAVTGPLAGKQLEPIPFAFDKIFWFAWKHFYPQTALACLPGVHQLQPETAGRAQPSPAT